MENEIKNALSRINEGIEMSYISAISRIESGRRFNNQFEINKELIDKYLKSRGYTMNTVSKQTVMAKGFVAVYNGGDFVEVFHDIPNRMKPVLIESSLLTGLPIALNYMERINN